MLLSCIRSGGTFLKGILNCFVIIESKLSDLYISDVNTSAVAEFSEYDGLLRT